MCQTYCELNRGIDKRKGFSEEVSDQVSELRSSDCQSPLTFVLWATRTEPPSYFTLRLRQEGEAVSSTARRQAAADSWGGERKKYIISTLQVSIGWENRHCSPVNHLGSVLGVGVGGGGLMMDRMCKSLFFVSSELVSSRRTIPAKINTCVHDTSYWLTSHMKWWSWLTCQTTSSLSYNTEDASVT